MADQMLQEIKDRLNVADVLSSYIQIKKAGPNFKALCPFHGEKTPSFQISPQKQIWHCFGCHEGGDIFGFVMRYENVDFKEALKILAQKAGVQLPQYRPASPQEQTEKELLFRINDFAARYYHELLIKDKRGAEALTYLKNRGLTLDTIKKWQIGFAPDDFHTLEQALGKKKIAPAMLVKAGVSAKNERGQIYDRFRGRVTFPIYNYNGETVGFSARILKDDGKSAKYVNSPETLIYSKSKVLFGLNFAKNSVRKNDEAIVVEGQMDCIAAHQAGFTNVVASSGTALTSDQLDLLGRLTRTLKFCFDADAAGLEATKRSASMYMGRDYVIKIIELAGGKDPDDVIKNNPQDFKKQVADARLFLDFYIDKLFADFNSSSVQQKKLVAKEILPLIKLLTDPVEQDHYVKILAGKFNTQSKVLWEALDKIKKTTAPSTAASVNQVSAARVSQEAFLEKQLLGGMLLYPDFASFLLKQASPDEFSDSIIRELVTKLGSGQAFEIKAEVVAKEALFMVESQRDQLEGGSEQQLRELRKTFAIFKLAGIKRQQQRLNMEIRQAETAGNKDQIHKLTEEFAKSAKLRMEFEKSI